MNHLILGIGGSATNDGGAGMIQALGGKLLKADGTPIAPGGAGSGRAGHHRPERAGSTSDRTHHRGGLRRGQSAVRPERASRRVRSAEGQLPRWWPSWMQSGRYADCIGRRSEAGEGSDPGTGADQAAWGAALVGLLGAELKPGIRIVIEALNLAPRRWPMRIWSSPARAHRQPDHPRQDAHRGGSLCQSSSGKPVIGIAGCLPMTAAWCIRRARAGCGVRRGQSGHVPRRVAGGTGTATGNNGAHGPQRGGGSLPAAQMIFSGRCGACHRTHRPCPDAAE